MKTRFTARSLFVLIVLSLLAVTSIAQLAGSIQSSILLPLLEGLLGTLFDSTLKIGPLTIPFGDTLRALFTPFLSFGLAILFLGLFMRWLWTPISRFLRIDSIPPEKK